jgi:hypothetical protein
VSCYGHRFAEEAISRIKKLGVPDVRRYIAIDSMFYKVTGARDICPHALSAHALLHRKSWRVRYPSRLFNLESFPLLL